MLTYETSKTVQINFSQHSSCIQLVFCSKVSIYICINILKILFNKSTHCRSSVKSMCARIEWNSEYISFKDEHSLGLLVKITWNIFKYMSTRGIPNGNSTLLKEFQVPYLF